MKFKEWLLMLEGQRGFKVESVDANGGFRNATPISLAIDNKATRSLIKGIGDGRAKIRAAMGAEPVDDVSVDELKDIMRKSMQYLYMPLQLPKVYQDGDAPPYFNKNLVSRARHVSSDPIRDPQIYNVDDTNAAIKDLDRISDEDMKTILYAYRRHDDFDSNKHDYAMNFTMALMMASLVGRMSKYSHLLDLERPQFGPRKSIPIPSRRNPTYGKDYNAEFNEILMCSFVFEPISKDARYGREVYDDIDSLIRDRINRRRGFNSQSDPLSPQNAGGQGGQTSQVTVKGGQNT